MFWIALELRSSKIGLIIKLPQSVKKLIVFKRNRVAESGNSQETT